MTKRKLQKQRKRHLAWNIRHKDSASVGGIDNESANSEESCVGESVPETTAVKPLATYEPIDVAVTSPGEITSAEMFSPSTANENVARSD